MRWFIVGLVALWPILGQADTTDAGKRLFALHCAACHGDDARGTGTVAPALSADPADLTGLARRNDGVFPAGEVVAKIDGRSPLTEHGGQMPVYGWFFEGPEGMATGADGEHIKTTEPIVEIVEWLRSIQR